VTLLGDIEHYKGDLSMERYLRVGAVLLIVCAALAAAPVNGDNITYAGPTERPNNLFADQNNWDIGTRYPGDGDRAIHDIGGEIVFNVSSTGESPHLIDYYRVTTDPGELTLQGAAGGTPRVLQTTLGMENTLSINDYLIHVGELDAFYVGDALDEETTTDADTENYEWMIDGDCDFSNKRECAMVAVTGTIGPGVWTVNRASLALGYGIQHVGSEGDTHMRIVPGTELDTSGTIDSGVTAPTPEQDQGTASTWNIDAARMQLERTVNSGRLT
jgi:hypothetical protein